MKKRILIAHDGSAAADAIFYDLPRAGLPEAAESVVLTVVEQSQSRNESASATHAGPIGSEAAALRAASTAAARLTSLVPKWDVRTETGQGAPAAAIMHYAEAWGANLILLGAVGHTVWERMLLGSVSQKIATESPCSVRIARGASSEKSVRILAGYDHMAGSQRTIEAILDRSWPEKARVIVHWAVGFGESVIADMPFPDQFAEAQTLLRPAQARLEAAGLDVSVSIVEDDPKVSILREAAHRRATCIFIGHNNHMLRSRLLLGTVASAIVPHASCSVELVRP